MSRGVVSAIMCDNQTLKRKRKTMKKYCLMWIAMTVLFLSNAAHAWDGNRKGFILGIGVGGGQTDIGDGEFGLLSNFKIGYAPSDRLLLYWHATGVYFEDPLGDLWADGMGGISAQYHFDDKPALATGQKS
jgi:hypothetical protein